eukprot:TRINITY_DN77745_c0_g1_i1.p1 TRINITY_DN77745_c0_g1~~TRINITY_DN77745_c0_g1_i1.p1  ORF type:complete len:236 (+),score=30.70 TRINITY_DN77745_c0_g1_i1:37-744(+)
MAADFGGCACNCLHALWAQLNRRPARWHAISTHGGLHALPVTIYVGLQADSASNSQSSLMFFSLDAMSREAGSQSALSSARSDQLFGQDGQQRRVHDTEDADSLRTITCSGSAVSWDGRTAASADSDESTAESSMSMQRWDLIPGSVRRVRQADANPTMIFQRVERPGQQAIMVGYSMDGREELRYEVGSDADDEVSEAGSSEIGLGSWNSPEALAMMENPRGWQRRRQTNQISW